MTEKMKAKAEELLGEGFHTIEEGDPGWDMLNNQFVSGKRGWIDFTERLSDGRQVNMGFMEFLDDYAYRFHIANPVYSHLRIGGEMVFVISREANKILQEAISWGAFDNR
jgi:hypothetical protein